MNKNKGFTLIELIVVMSIIGILVLLATPKFLNYIEEAKITQITHDIKVAENMALAEYVRMGKLPEDFKILEEDKIEEAIDKGIYYTKLGKVERELVRTNKEAKTYYEISNKFKTEKFKSALKGTFIVDDELNASYMDARVATGGSGGDVKLVTHSIEGIYDVELYEELDIKVTHTHNIEDNIWMYREGEDENWNANIWENIIFYPEKYMNYTIDYNGKYEDGEEVAEDIDYELVILGFKNKNEINNHKLLKIPESLACTCGKKHNVVAIGKYYGQEREVFKEQLDGSSNEEFSQYVFGQNDNTAVYDIAYPNVDELLENKDLINKVIIPSTVRSIGVGAFRSVGLKEIVFAENSQLEVIAASAFFNSDLRKLELPRNLKVIGRQAFANLRNKTEHLEIKGLAESTSLRAIAKDTFKGTRPYTSDDVEGKTLEISDTVEYIGEGAFSCSKSEPYLEKLKLSHNESIYSFEDDVFLGISKAEELVIPKNTMYIFYNNFKIDTPIESDAEENYPKAGSKITILGTELYARNYPLAFNNDKDNMKDFFDYVRDQYKTNQGNYIKIYNETYNNWTFKYESLDGQNTLEKTYNGLTN